MLNNQEKQKLAKVLIDFCLINTCTNCCFWNKEKGTCDKFMARPPAETIVTGCIEWQDPIPF